MIESSNPWIIVVVALITSTISPLLLSSLNNRNRRIEKQEEYKRQDEVAARAEAAAQHVQAVAARAEMTARILVQHQDEAASKAEESAAFLVVNTAKVAEAAIATNQKLDALTVGQSEIHTLVNSNLTAALRSELDALRQVAAGMTEIIELKKRAGVDPDTSALGLVQATNDRIDELSAALADRLRQQPGAQKE